MTTLPGARTATGNWMTVHVWTSTCDFVATLEGHTNSVYGLACTLSGDIVSGSADGTVKVWRDNTCVHTLDGHGFAIFAVTVSPFDGAIVSGSWDKTAKVWSPSTGECMATLTGHTDAVLAVCILDNGDVVTGSGDKTVRVWERGSWEYTAVYQARGEVLVTAKFPGEGLVVGGGDYRAGGGFVSLWRGGSREWAATLAECVRELTVVQDVIVACTISSVCVIHNGVCVNKWDASDPHGVTLSNGSVAVVQTENDGSLFKMYRVVRPARLATIRVMIKAWSLHGGTPPPTSAPRTRSSRTAAAVLARTLSLRRLWRGVWREC